MNKIQTYTFLVFLCAIPAVWMIVLVRESPSSIVDKNSTPSPEERFFSVQAIDTMKYSRDLARQSLGDRSFDEEIERQMEAIKGAGATHVAIGTPYDDEFIPIMERWISSARRHGLSVWFRGNLSGWEGWFDYPAIGQREHIRMISSFIENNAQLFEDGDLFSPCPECENGGPGDPRVIGNASEFNQFMINKNIAARNSFQLISVDVDVVHSMNADIARDILDPDRSDQIGIILIDHYVREAQDLARDLIHIASIHDMNIGIGEFGAPIPDIHGHMSEEDQAMFVERSIEHIIKSKSAPSIISYWTLKGGSTAIMNDDGTFRLAYHSLASYFSPAIIEGSVMDRAGKGVPNTVVSIEQLGLEATSTENGSYRILSPSSKNIVLRFDKDGYYSRETIVNAAPGINRTNITIEKVSPNIWEKILFWIGV